MTWSAKRLLRALIGAVGFVATGIAAIVLLAWFTGRVVSDRYAWSQWLLWIPTAAAFAAAALGCLGALRPTSKPGRRRRRLARWSVLLLLTGVFFSCVDHRLLRRANPAPAGLKLVHWNMTMRLAGAEQPPARRVVALDGDVTILTSAGTTPWNRIILDWLGEEHRPRGAGPFTVLTRLPIVELRMLVATEEISIAQAEIDASESLGRSLVILMIDLPSNPRRSRYELAVHARELLDHVEAATPDIVVGDLNITRDSASLAHLLPRMRHAFAEAGHGWGGSFPGDFPMYHIDHVMLASSICCSRYDLVPATGARHHAQIAYLVPCR